MQKNKDRMRYSNKTAKRGVILLVVLVVGFMGACIARVGWISLVKGDYYKNKADEILIDDDPLYAHRGTIYDSEMKILAQSASVWLAYVKPDRVNDENREAVINGLGDILGLDKAKLRSDIEANSSQRYLKVKGKFEYAEKVALSEYIYDNDLVGVIQIDPDTKRYYPNGSLASTVLGFTGTDGNGLYGLEYFYDDELTGTNGKLVTLKDGIGNEIDNAFKSAYEAKDGTDLVLTINSEIQTILEDALRTALVENGATNVYGIVMNTKTGAILAEANLPDYDPNDPYSINDETVLAKLETITIEEEKNEAISQARFSQWKNKSISDFYEPGSVFKVFLVSAALEEGVIDEETSYYCSGTIEVADRTVKDFSPTGHGYETPRTLLVNSCNTFSVYVGQRMGVDLFYKYFEAFGFTEKTGIDLSGEGVPVASVTYHSPEISFSTSDLASSSFGQSISVTPLQIVTAVSAIGNGGKLMQPYVVAKKLDCNGNTVSETQPVVKRQVISEKTANLVASYMEGVVEGGTGTNAYVPGYHVAGKTGTSEKLTSADSVYIASFAGFAPCYDPEISVVIIIDEPSAGNYSGGVIAAPVAGEIFEKTLKYLGIEPDYSEDEVSSLSALAPDLVGMDISDAQREVRENDFNVRVIGNGSTVVSQSPEAGRSTTGNGIIVLYTEEGIAEETVEVPDFTGLTISQANQLAVSCGLNIKISGGSYTNYDIEAYKQDIEYGTDVALGTFVTVSFRTNLGIVD